MFSVGQKIHVPLFTVQPSVVKTLEPFYNAFDMAPLALEKECSIAAQHCKPMRGYGMECGKKGSPYIGKCGHGGAVHALETLCNTSLSPGTAEASNLFLLFDQT